MPEEQHKNHLRTETPLSNRPTPHPILAREEIPEPVILEEHVIGKKSPIGAPPSESSVSNAAPTTISKEKPNLNPLSAIGSFMSRKAKTATPLPDEGLTPAMPALGISMAKENEPTPFESALTPHSLGVSISPPSEQKAALAKLPEKDTSSHLKRERMPDTPPIRPQPEYHPPSEEVPIPAITAVMPQSTTAKTSHLSSILGSIKLPERKEFRGKADSPRFENKMVPIAPSSPEPVALGAQPETPVKKKEFDIPSVHTLRDDLDQLVEGQKLSMVKAAALEQDKRTKGAGAQEKIVTPKRGTKRLLGTVLFSLFLILLGGVALATIAIVASQRQQSTAAPALSSIMFSEKTLSFPVDNLSPLDTKKQLALSRSQIPLSLGAIARVVPTGRHAVADGTTVETPLTTEEFFTSIGAQLPEGFARSLSNEFFFGVHALDQNSPVLVLPIAVYERAFAGALAWEKSMNEDLAPIFAPVPAQTITQEGNVVSRKFEDVIIQNYDVRIVRDHGGTVRLLYAFPTRDILIIAESPNSFTETLARLRAERRL